MSHGVRNGVKGSVVPETTSAPRGQTLDPAARRVGQGRPSRRSDQEGGDRMTVHGNVKALLAYVETIEVEPIERVGEPEDGSIRYQRVLRIKAHGTRLVLTLMADEAEILEAL
jgi:hypothetical protein